MCKAAAKCTKSGNLLGGHVPKQRMMVKSADYSGVEHLRDGGTIQIRALRPDDQQAMLAAIARTSPQSLQRRFFVPKRGFSEKEVSYFMGIDFSNHVALVAQIDETARR